MEARNQRAATGGRMTIFVTLDDQTELALLPEMVVGCCKAPAETGGAIIFTDHGNFSTHLTPAEVRARVEAGIVLANN